MTEIKGCMNSPAIILKEGGIDRPTLPLLKLWFSKGDPLQLKTFFTPK
jgi:hypothetical protein